MSETDTEADAPDQEADADAEEIVSRCECGAVFRDAKFGRLFDAVTEHVREEHDDPHPDIDTEWP